MSMVIWLEFFIPIPPPRPLPFHCVKFKASVGSSASKGGAVFVENTQFLTVSVVDVYFENYMGRPPAKDEPAFVLLL